MADKLTLNYMGGPSPRRTVTTGHAMLVNQFRAKLAGKKSPLDRIPLEQLEQARAELRELPEVAGEPLPAKESMAR